MDVKVRPPRVLQILDHDFAALETSLAKADFEDLDVLDLGGGARQVWTAKGETGSGRRPHLSLERIVLDEQQPLRQKNLQLLHEDVLRVVDADQELDDVAPLGLSVVWRAEEDQRRERGGERGRKKH